MKRKNIESVIVSSTNMQKDFLPLDVLLMEGLPFNEENKEKNNKNVNPIIVRSINYIGTARKVPYAPISTIFSIDF